MDLACSRLWRSLQRSKVRGAGPMAPETFLSRLEAVRLTHAPARFDARELEALPAPLQRYFRMDLQDDEPVIAALSASHIGAFNMS